MELHGALVDEESILGLRNGLAGLETLKLGRKNLVQGLEGQKANEGFKGRRTNRTRDDRLELLRIKRPWIVIWLAKCINFYFSAPTYRERRP